MRFGKVRGRVGYAALTTLSEAQVLGSIKFCKYIYSTAKLGSRWVGQRRSNLEQQQQQNTE